MYIRTEDGVYEYKNNNVFKYITKETVVDAGYGKELPKGSFVKIGETWVNYYGRWTSIIDKNGNIYDIRPNRVEEVIEEIKYKQADTIKELCDGFYIDEGNEFSFYEENAYEDFEEAKKDFFTNFDNTSTLYAFIKTTKGLIYVAKMNEKGVLELI